MGASFLLRFAPLRRLSSSSASDAVNSISRILSDHRSPEHDLSPHLHSFAPVLLSSPGLLPNVLARCRHLPSPAHRLFLFASNLGADVSSSHPILLQILANARLFPLVWAHLSDLRNSNSTINSTLFHLIFRAYARAGLPADAVRAFLRMPDYNLTPTIHDLHQLLLPLCRNNLTDHAHTFFDKVSSQLPVTQKTYSILINGYAAAVAGGAGVPAVQLFDEMVQRGLGVDVVAYNTLMAALCQGGEVEEAYRRLKEMRRVHGLKPDAATYAVFVRAACGEKDLNAAMRVMETMRQRGLAPNVFTYNCVIKLMCECADDKLDEVYGLLDEMIEKGMQPDVWSYNTVLAAHCRLREVNKATRVLLRMDRDGCAPDRHTYNVLLKMLIRVGRIDRAMEVWDGMEGRGFYPPAACYAVMIHGLGRKKTCIKEACKYFEAMVDEGIPPYLSTCELLRSQLKLLGMKETVHVLTDKMQRSTSCVIQELSSVMAGKKRRAERHNVVCSEV